MILINEAMPRLESLVATEMPTRSVRERSLVLIPDGLSTRWHAPTGQPKCFHIHVPRSLRDAWTEEMRPGPVRPPVNAGTPEIESLFTRIGAELRSDDTLRKLKLQGLALAAVAACYRMGGLRVPRTPCHFSRTFKAVTGQSPYAFVVQVRVARVKGQHLSGRGTPADIAMDCGFAIQSHMTETFRRTTGLSPARRLREQRRSVPKGSRR